MKGHKKKHREILETMMDNDDIDSIGHIAGYFLLEGGYRKL